MQSIFGFQRLSRDDPLANVRSLRVWADGVARNDPVAAVEQIALLIRDEASKPEGSAHRLEALLELDRVAAPHLELLRTQYRQIAISDDLRQRLLQLCETISQGFAQAWGQYARNIETSETPVTARGLRHAVFARLFHHQATLTRLGLFRYEHWIPGRWRALHQAYRAARLRSLALEPYALLPSRASEQSSAEQEYIAILLLQRLNTGNLTTPQIDWASEWVREWVAMLRLGPPPRDPVNGFWLDLGDAEGLTDRATKSPQGEVLFLDMEPLRAQLKALIGRLMSQGVAGRLASDSEDALTLAKRVDRLWQPQAPVLQRRGERRAASNGATVAVGWQEIVMALQSRHARSVAPPGYHYDDRGRLRNNSELRDLVGRRLEKFTWQIADSSDSGYRIRSSSRDATRQWPGALLALQVEDSPGWRLAVVRRLRRVGSDLTELGVEVISRNVSMATPRDIESRDSGYSVDGVDVQVTGKGFQAIYLPPQAHGRGQSPASLVIPPPEFVLHRKLSLTVDGRVHSIVLASPLERSRDWVWTPLRSG